MVGVLVSVGLGSACVSDPVNLVEDLTDELTDLPARDAQQVFCRYSNALEGRVSVRTGLGLDPDPLLCYDSGVLSGTRLLGGVALALCWDAPETSIDEVLLFESYDPTFNVDDDVTGNGVGAGWEGFQDSACADAALTEWGFDADSFEASRDGFSELVAAYAEEGLGSDEQVGAVVDLICTLPGELSTSLEVTQAVVCP
jgi:hypothetical protein